jgi:hypothetical protein
MSAAENTKQVRAVVMPEYTIPFEVKVQGTAGLTQQFVQDMVKMAQDAEHPGNTPFLQGLLAACTTVTGVNHEQFAIGLVRQAVRSTVRGTVAAVFAEQGQALTLAPVVLDVLPAVPQKGKKIKHPGGCLPDLLPGQMVRVTFGQAIPKPARGTIGASAGCGGMTATTAATS